MMNYIYLLKQYNQPIAIHHSHDAERQNLNETKSLKLIAENGKDMLELSEDSLLFIESADNYSTIFYEKDGNLQKELLRSSLTRIEAQIASENIVFLSSVFYCES